SINRDRVATVCNRRHVAVDAVLLAALDELPANFRIFILVFDQGAAFAQARRRSFAVVARARIVEGRRILAAAETKRDVPGRLRAGVEVGVEPAVGRAINTARLPIASDDLVAFAVLEGTNARFFWPHIDIALRAHDQQYRSRGVVMGLVIDAGWPFGHMSDQAVIGHFEAGDSSLSNLVRRGVEGRGSRVGDE